MRDTTVNKKSRVMQGDIILRDGILYYLEEEMVEEQPLADIFAPFVDSFCKVSITNEIKKDTIEDGAVQEG